MNNRHLQFFGKNLQAHTVCGKTFFSMDVDTFEPPFEVVHFKGEHNLEGCQGCSNSLGIMKTEMNDYFKKFPNCCTAHQNLLKQDWFYVGNYSDL